MDKEDPDQGKELLVLAQAGDLILWDSRTKYRDYVGPGFVPAACPLKPGDLSRLSFTVCMTPKEWASSDVLMRRHQSYLKGIPLNHWPHEYKSNILPGVPNKGATWEAFHPPAKVAPDHEELLGISSE